MVETHLIETFVEVVRKGSVTRAAHALDRSQPAVSHRLKQLEAAFGTPLFEKVGRELQLTEAGERLFDEAVDILQRIQGLHQRVHATEEPRGRVTIGASVNVDRYLLVESIGQILLQFPLVKPVIRHASSERLRAMLLAGELDIVVAAEELDATGLEIEPLAVSRLRAVFHPDDAPVGRLGIDHLRDHRLLVWRSEHDRSAQTVEEWAVSKGLIDDSTPEIPEVSSLLSLVESRAGYTVLPDYVVRRAAARGGLEAVPVPGLPDEVPIVLATRAGWVGGVAGDRVRETIVRLLSD